MFFKCAIDAEIPSRYSVPMAVASGDRDDNSSEYAGCFLKCFLNVQLMLKYLQDTVFLWQWQVETGMTTQVNTQVVFSTHVFKWSSSSSRAVFVIQVVKSTKVPQGGRIRRSAQLMLKDTVFLWLWQVERGMKLRNIQVNMQVILAHMQLYKCITSQIILLFYPFSLFINFI